MALGILTAPDPSMSLKVRGLLAVSIGLVLGLTLSLGSVVLAERDVKPASSLPWDEARLLAEVLERVKRDYVDDVDDSRLIEAAIRGMVADLDPHSAYLDPDEYEEIRVSTTGNYSGVGLEVSVENERVVVVTPIEGSPADAAGIQPGDVVISVDGMPVDVTDLNDTVARLRGMPGSEVRLGVLRLPGEAPLTYDLVRARVQVSSVRHEVLDGGVGYVRITHFSETTAPDLREAVGEMQRARGGALSGLVLDLRNNPGGVLEAAGEVADAFLDGGLIVSADGRVSDARFQLEAEPGDIMDGGPVTLLVNGGSASASEIVAGALQDHGRARIVGEPTFGKGSVQTVMPLSRGRAIKLTTSRYYTPSGRSIHERGITPDLVAHMPENGAAGDVSLADPQLDAAVGLLKDHRIRHSRAD
jgi:carboxyl-terminal processing protease